MSKMEFGLFLATLTAVVIFTSGADIQLKNSEPDAQLKTIFVLVHRTLLHSQVVNI